MPSIPAPGGAYHYRTHKSWGARQEVEWRKKVKDHISPNRLRYRQRRDKAVFNIIKNSDAAPTGYRFITVGERWGERGKAVDEFLAAIDSLPPVREKTWEIYSGYPIPGSQVRTNEQGFAQLLEATLRESLVTSRQELQYHTDVTMIAYGQLSTQFSQAVIRRCPTYGCAYTCMSDESREEAWNSMFMGCAYCVSQLVKDLRAWEYERKDILRSVVEDVSNPYEHREGILKDPKNRFQVVWGLSAAILERLQWQSYLQVQIESGAGQVYCANAEPSGVFNQFTYIMDNLKLSTPVAPVAGRRIIDLGDE